MNWLTPLTGVILAASLIPPLVLLYFLKLRRRAQPIASTLLWKRSVEDLRANAPFQRLRRNLLLLLQLLAIMLLALSVMQPQIQSGRQRGGRTVLLIDNSASMNATDVEEAETRLDDAKRRARERIEQLYGGGLLSGAPGETMIVAFSDRAEIASRFSASRPELLAAIDRIRPTHGETTLDEALKLARAYTTNVDPETEGPVSTGATLEVFTDGHIRDLDDQVLRGERMVYHRIGREVADNVAISAVEVDRPYDRPGAVEVFVAMLNFNQETVTCDVQLSVDLDARAVEGITMPAAEIDPSNGVLLPGRNNVVFTPFDQPRGAVIEIANLRPDDLMVDNVAQTVVPPPKQLRVGLVEAKSFMIRAVLEGMALERLELLTAGQYERLAGDGSLDDYDVIVLDNYAPPEGLMPPGRYLSFGVTPPIEGLHDFGEADVQIVLSARDEHPVMRFVRLDELFIASGRLVQPGETVEVLAEASHGPAILSVSHGPMQVIHVTFNPVRSNWPLLRSWVTFVFNAVDYLGHVGEGVTNRDRRVGEAITSRVPAGARNIELRTPEGFGVVELTPDATSVVGWGPIRLSGLYLLTWTMPGQEEPESRPIAVNLLSESEGRISSIENLEIGQETVQGSAGASAYTPLWPWAIGLCLVVLMLEWWVYHRRAYL